MADKYKYFLYSDEQIEEMNSILEKRGKEFVPGIVNVGSSRKKFTQLYDHNTMPRYIDCKIVAEGYLSQMNYTMPTNKRRDS